MIWLIDAFFYNQLQQLTINLLPRIRSILFLLSQLP
jgi:hypothetical protein